MKKITFILLVAASSVWFGCSKKNDPAPLTPVTAKAADIVGKWNETADTLFSNTSGQSSIIPVSEGSYFQFNNGGTGIIGNAGTDGEVSEEVFNYTINNGTLVLTVPNSSSGVAGSETLSIYNITKSSLGLRWNNSANTHEDAWLTK